MIGGLAAKDKKQTARPAGEQSILDQSTLNFTVGID